MTRLAALPPGQAGFRALRTDPQPLPDDPGKRRDLELLFNLMGYVVAASSGFNASSEGLPASPATPDPRGESAVPPWEYARVLPVARFAASSGTADPVVVAGYGPICRCRHGCHDRPRHARRAWQSLSVTGRCGRHEPALHRCPARPRSVAGRAGELRPRHRHLGASSAAARHVRHRPLPRGSGRGLCAARRAGSGRPDHPRPDRVAAGPRRRHDGLLDIVRPRPVRARSRVLHGVPHAGARVDRYRRRDGRSVAPDGGGRHPRRHRGVPADHRYRGSSPRTPTRLSCGPAPS